MILMNYIMNTNDEEIRFSPMLINNVIQKAFDDKDYLFEIKFDGIRVLGYFFNGKTKLFSRNNVDITSKFPEIKFNVPKNCVVDGEIVVIDDQGPNFSKVMKRFKSTNCLHDTAKYIVFDVLYYDNKNVTSKSLIERKDILKKCLIRKNKNVELIEYVIKNGKKLFDLAKTMNLEGIVGKKMSSKYYCGKRTDEWIKIKNTQDDDFIVVYFIIKSKGYTLGLAQIDNLKLIYKGEVTYYGELNNLKRCKSYKVVGLNPEGKEFFVKPVNKCTVNYLEYTKNQHLRHPVFKTWIQDAG